jgi:hypothetical protein
MHAKGLSDSDALARQDTRDVEAPYPLLPSGGVMKGVASFDRWTFPLSADCRRTGIPGVWAALSRMV